MKRLLSLTILLSCLLTLCACGGQPTTDPEEPAAEPGTEAAVLAEAVYPSTVPCPRQEDYPSFDAFMTAYNAWSRDVFAMRDQPEGYADGLESYFDRSVRQYLAGAGEENRVFSPLNLYMALGMLAEVTDGESRQQILDLLGAESLEALRSQAGALWRASYQDDGVVASILASSLWLSDRETYRSETLEDLAEHYFASSFRGEMGSPEYDAMLQSWINEQTGGLLQGQASGLHMSPETVLALAATIYFKAPWTDSFAPEKTESGVFYGPGGEQTLDFLHASRQTDLFWGERFTAAGLSMGNGGAMWFVLPDEGVTPEELLDDPEAMSFLLCRNKYEWENQKYLMVNYAVPKFDVSSDLDLIEGLRALGIDRVLDPARADFSPLTEDADELYVSQARHAARVLVDEDGCEAAAYTVIMVAAGAAMPPEDEADFVLDRPFLFVITNSDGLPLFTGLVNRPAE